MAAGQATSNLRAVAAKDAAANGLGSWFLRQINQESRFDPNARSSAGAEGIAQFEPATAKSVGLADPFDPVAALAAAAKFDAQLLHRYGSVPAALSAYNSGNPNAYKDPGFAGGQTFNYVRDILGGSGGGGGGGGMAPREPVAPGRTAALPKPKRAASNPNIAAALRLLGFSAPAAVRTPLVAAPSPTVPRVPPPAATGATLPLAGLVAGNTQGETTRFLQDLARLASYEHAPVRINSGYRSYADQANLYANRASNPNPVAKPGSSLHERGLAADGTVNGSPLGTIPAAVLAQFGLATVPGDPVHVQLAGVR